MSIPESKLRLLMTLLAHKGSPADASAVANPAPVDTTALANRAMDSSHALDAHEDVPHRLMPVTGSDRNWWDHYDQLLKQNNAQNDTLRRARGGDLPTNRRPGKNPVRESP